MSIVKMKRLRLIGMRDQREELLRLLQHMGCVEVSEPEDRKEDPEWASLTRPDPAPLTRAREAKASAEAALRTLAKYAPKEKSSPLAMIQPRPAVTEARIMDEWNEEMQGEVLEVLCEGFDGQSMMYTGRSWAESPDIDGKIYFTAESAPETGSFVRVRITGAMDGELTGERVP